MSQEQQEQQEQVEINFTPTNLPIPTAILKLSLENQTEVYNYLIQMNEYQKKAYLIAQNHLGTSFSIIKSNGFIEWKKANKK